MVGRQNYGPFLGTLITRCRMRRGIQKGTIILTTTHLGFWVLGGYTGDNGESSGKEHGERMVTIFRSCIRLPAQTLHSLLEKGSRKQ